MIIATSYDTSRHIDADRWRNFARAEIINGSHCSVTDYCMACQTMLNYTYRRVDSVSKQLELTEDIVAYPRGSRKVVLSIAEVRQIRLPVSSLASNPDRTTLGT
eukprot:1326156-Amorphochlora_amoeboformis.AAC.3